VEFAPASAAFFHPRVCRVPRVRRARICSPSTLCWARPFWHGIVPCPPRPAPCTVNEAHRSDGASARMLFVCRTRHARSRSPTQLLSMAWRHARRCGRDRGLLRLQRDGERALYAAPPRCQQHAWSVRSVAVFARTGPRLLLTACRLLRAPFLLVAPPRAPSSSLRAGSTRRGV
jgi:hypothetical protein